MKKLLSLAVAAAGAAGAAWVVNRVRADRAEADLWAEATDSVPEPSRGP